MRQQWFTHVRLLIAHPPRYSETSTAALTTPALDRRSLRWFGVSACTATPEDLPPSLAQHGSCRRSSTSSSSLPFRTHVGAGNSAVVVDLPRWGPMLSPRVPILVPIPGPRMERGNPWSVPTTELWAPTGVGTAFGVSAAAPPWTRLLATDSCRYCACCRPTSGFCRNPFSDLATSEPWRCHGSLRVRSHGVGRQFNARLTEGSHHAPNRCHPRDARCRVGGRRMRRRRRARSG